MTLGDGRFESGTFGTPVVTPPGGLKLVELDGTVRNVANVPHAFLPDGTGFRVFARFIDEGENLVTYDGVVAVYVNYDVIEATYETYEELRADWPVALVGVPPGGTAGQVLKKTSGADYAVGWVT
jgi:hypothetical protein